MAKQETLLFIHSPISLLLKSVSDPEVLFLDEPTSGLDSNSSFSVLSNVKTESEKTGRIVVSTIHQPSFEVLSLFTKVILLAPGGRLIYDGSSADALTHFESLGFICPSRKNPADFFLDLLTLEDASQKEAHEQSMARVERLVVAYKKVEASRKSEASSSTLTVHKKGTEDVERLEKKKGSSVINSNHVPFANNWFQEFAILLRRAWLDLVRNKQLLIGSLAQTM